jgi:hypothetical protein
MGMRLHRRSIPYHDQLVFGQVSLNVLSCSSLLMCYAALLSTGLHDCAVHDAARGCRTDT